MTNRTNGGKASAGLTTEARHYHVRVDVATGEASLIAHDHIHAGPPHSHRDTALVEVMSASMYDRAQARAALNIFRVKRGSKRRAR